MKKVICILICILFTVGIFSGCEKKKDDGSAQVTLRWMTVWAEQKDREIVQEYFNEKLAKLLPNTKVEMFHLDDAAFALKMAAKEKIDITWTGYSHDFPTEISNGYFLELNDLIDEYAPAVKEEWESYSDAYASATVDGNLYALPIQQPIVHQTSFFQIPAKYNEYLDSDALLAECHNNYKTTEKVWQIIDKYFHNLINAGIFDNTGFYTSKIFSSIATRGYDFVESSESGGWLCYDAHAENPEIVSFCTTEEAKTFYKYAAKWYKEGIIPLDILTGSETTASGASTVAISSKSESWYNVDEERGVRYEYDENGEIKSYIYLLDDYDNLFTGSTIIGSMRTYNAIPFTAENPERAMMFLNLLRSNTEESNELVNILCYGFEESSDAAQKYGTYHYTLEEKEDGDHVAHGKGYVIQPDASSDYGMPHWKLTNAFLPYRTPNILDGQKEWAKDYLTNVVPNELYKTKLYHFTPNLAEDYSFELAQLSQVTGEYLELLYDGAMGDKWEDTYAEFEGKLKAAGIENILTVVNEKAQEYMKEN